MRKIRIGIGVAMALAGACSSQTGGGGAAGQNFELVCDSTDTKESSTLFCMRHDTRDGDVLRVDMGKLPQSNGPTKAAAAAGGTYQLVCDSTDTDTKSDFRCIRLHTGTGELLLVNLPKVGVFPQ